jgi:hypothetical protein
VDITRLVIHRTAEDRKVQIRGRRTRRLIIVLTVALPTRRRAMLTSCASCVLDTMKNRQIEILGTTEINEILYAKIAEHLSHTLLSHSNVILKDPCVQKYYPTQ